MLIKSKNFDSVALNHFTQQQRLSFSILEQTASELRGGESEKDIAHILVKRYRVAGATSFFHLPVVLFGKRTALPDDWRLGNFFPKSNTLKEGDSIILDAAPLFDGYLVDTSYSCCLGNNPAHRNMMSHLAQYRQSIPKAINQGFSFKHIADSVLATMLKSGYQAAHTKHPGQVLGHRSIKTRKLPFQPRAKGFDALSLSWFKSMDSLALRGIIKHSPLWNSQDNCDNGAPDGLWLVEPHIGSDDGGAK